MKIGGIGENRENIDKTLTNKEIAKAENRKRSRNAGKLHIRRNMDKIETKLRKYIKYEIETNAKTFRQVEEIIVKGHRVLYPHGAVDDAILFNDCE